MSAPKSYYEFTNYVRPQDVAWFLEKLRKKLLSLSRDYLDELSRNTWLTSPGFAAVPAEWEIEQPERFREVVSKLHQLAEDILNAHQSLIRLGRKKLGL